MTPDPATATATELAAAIASRQLSSRELLDDLLARAARVNPSLNAIVACDADAARAAAAAADAATARGEPAGPLHGLPMTVKDVWETAGLVTTAGARELARHIPAADAPAVARLRRAGAIIFGKTNTPEYAGDWQTYNDVYGRTANPWDPSRTAGGSSGGAAAAVAAGLTPLELGSDIGGSIRIPAHFNGVYGLKPSWGIVPSRGHIPGEPGSLVTVDVSAGGPIARSVADLRTALRVVAGPLPEDAAGWRLELDAGPALAGVAGLRVATVFGAGDGLLPAGRDVTALLEGFAARLAAAGAKVEETPLPVPLADGLQTWTDLVAPIIGAGLPDPVFTRLAAGQDSAGQHSAGQHSAGQHSAGQHGGRPLTAMERAMAARFRDVLAATGRRQRQRAAWAEFFRRYDVVLAPVMPVAAFPHDTGRPFAERTLDVDGAAVPHWLATAWLCAIGVMLLPVVTVPAGLTPAGLPAGVQLVGPFLSDLRLLRIAERADAAAGPGFTPPPPLPGPDGPER